MQKLGAVVMLGARGQTPQERLVAEMQQAATLDLILMLKELNIKPIILCAPELHWWPEKVQIWLSPDPDVRSFHFGAHLAETIVVNRLDHVMYFGGASAPLLDLQLLKLLLKLFEQSSHEQVAITNNLHSSDWLVLSNVHRALPHIQKANRDNGLAWVLQEECGYDVRVLTEMRPAVALDLDTPTDLAILRQHPECPPNLRQATENTLLDAIPVQSLLKVLTSAGSHVTIIGRVGPRAWDALSAATQVWIRVFSEERGMVASERIDRSEVQSLLGVLLDLQGPEAFFRTLADMTDAAIIDSRVLMAHQGLHPSDADRFASDLFMVDAIQNEWIRTFTAAAANASIPVVLGGHNVVSGGLHVLSEILEMRRQPPH